MAYVATPSSHPWLPDGATTTVSQPAVTTVPNPTAKLPFGASRRNSRGASSERLQLELEDLIAVVIVLDLGVGVLAKELLAGHPGELLAAKGV